LREDFFDLGFAGEAGFLLAGISAFGVLASWGFRFSRNSRNRSAA